MCSVGEEEFDDDGAIHTMPTNNLVSMKNISVVCSKCGKDNADFKLPFREQECCDCFFLYVRHKFRATLGASKALPKDAKVLIVFDGSENSVCLLDMMHQAQTLNKHKRINCCTKVLHIDDYELNPSTNIVEYHQYILTMRKFLELYEQFECFITPIGNMSAHPVNIKFVDEYLNRDRTFERKFKENLSLIRTTTSLNDYLRHYRTKVIAAAAQHLKCSYALVDDISTTLASQLLTAISLGRGGNAALDVGLVDHRLANGIKMLRPLRDLNETEVKMYLKARKLQCLQNQTGESSLGTKTSLQSLTASFVQTLQQNFPSTVSTVFRTGDKIAPISTNGINDHNQTSRCSFCNSLLDNKSSTTLLATEFSRLVSQVGASAFLSDSETNQEASKCDDTILCHACQNIQADSTSRFHL